MARPRREDDPGKEVTMKQFENIPPNGPKSRPESARTSRVAAISLAVLVATLAVLPGTGRAQAGKQGLAVAPTTLQTDPAQLLARIQDLEKRLAAAERRLTELDQLKARYAKHTHEYRHTGFNGSNTLGGLLANPTAFRDVVIPYSHGNLGPPAVVSTSGPKE
jgi:hypothetical protein